MLSSPAPTWIRVCRECLRESTNANIPGQWPSPHPRVRNHTRMALPRGHCRDRRNILDESNLNPSFLTEQNYVELDRGFRELSGSRDKSKLASAERELIPSLCGLQHSRFPFTAVHTVSHGRDSCIGPRVHLCSERNHFVRIGGPSYEPCFGLSKLSPRRKLYRNHNRGQYGPDHSVQACKSVLQVYLDPQPVSWFRRPERRSLFACILPSLPLHHSCSSGNTGHQSVQD